MNSSKGLTERALGGVAWSGTASLVRVLLKVVSLAILARLLSPKDYGVVAGAIVALELATLLGEIGLATTIAQRADLQPRHTSTAYSSTLIVSALAAAAMWSAAPAIAELMRIEELTVVVRAMSVIVPLRALAGLAGSLLARNMKMKEAAVSPLMSWVLATFVICIPMAYLGYGYTALVAMNVAEAVLVAGLLTFHARGYLQGVRFHREALREMLPMSVGFSINQPLIYFANNIDKFLISRTLGVESLGLHSRSAFIAATTANQFANIARIVVFPLMAKVQGDVKRLASGFEKATSLTALATLPVAAYCICMASELVHLLLGPKWSAAVIPFALLAGSIYFRLGWRNCYAVFQALGKPKWLNWLQLFNAAMALGCVYAALPYGLNGVCAAVLGVTAATFVVGLGMCSVSLELSAARLVRAHAGPIAVALLTALVCLLVRHFGAGLPPLLLLGIATACAAALALAILVFRPPILVGVAGKEAIEIVIRRLGSRLAAKATD